MQQSDRQEGGITDRLDELFLFGGDHGGLTNSIEQIHRYRQAGHRDCERPLVTGLFAETAKLIESGVIDSAATAIGAGAQQCPGCNPQGQQIALAGWKSVGHLFGTFPTGAGRGDTAIVS